MSPIKQEDTANLKQQAQGVFRRIFLSAKRNLTPAKPHNKLTSRTSSSSSSRRSRSLRNLGSQDGLHGTTGNKPKISYPMKLHNSEHSSFVTTQDPWEASVHSSILHRRATVRTTHSHARSASDSRLSAGCPPPAQDPKRLSFSIQQRASKDSIATRTPSLKPQQQPSSTPLAVTTSLNTSTCTVRPKSATSQTAAHTKPSSNSDDTSSLQRSQNHSFPPHRGSLYRHPPTRPLSLSHHSRRNSLMVSGDEQGRMDGRSSTRRSSMASSNHTSTTSQLRQSWTTGRAVMDPAPPPQGPPALPSSDGPDQRPSVILSAATTDQKSVSNSLRRPAPNDWAGVIEEDITLTLMGCPQDQPPATPPTNHGPTPPVSVAKPASPPPTTAPLGGHNTSTTPSPAQQIPSPSDAAGMEAAPSPDASSQEAAREDACSAPATPGSASVPASASACTEDASVAAAPAPLVVAVDAATSPPSSRPCSAVLPSATLPRPASILLRPLVSTPHLLDVPLEGKLVAGPDWYADLMSSVEQSISKFN